jgi:hypothetical protein
MAEEEYKDPKDDVIKVFEDDDVLIVSPLTTFANRYYGQKSPWYDESWSGTREFNKNLESGGKIYYIVNKKTGEKEGFYKDEFGQSWYNENSKIGKEEVESYIQWAPSAKKIIINLTSNNVFKNLRQFAKGQITEYRLELSDDLIYDVKKSEKHLGESIVIMEFSNDEDLFDVLDLSDDDKWFLNVIMSRGSYEFTDGDRMWEDNKEGYGIFRWFNGENMVKLREISRMVLPSEEFDEQNEQFMGKLFRKLDEHFDRELNNMTYTYIDEFNEKSTEFARKEITEEFNRYFKNKGFTLIRNFDRISTTVVELIYLYSTTGKKTDDLKTLLGVVLKPEARDSLGGWAENQYEYDARTLDDEYLNREFETNLDKILDELTENDGFKEYLELNDRITSKYKLNTFYATPKDKNILFQIKKVDPSTLRLQVMLRKSGSNDWDKTHWFTEENFNKFLHQPELFSIFDEK